MFQMTVQGATLEDFKANLLSAAAALGEVSAPSSDAPRAGWSRTTSETATGASTAGQAQEGSSQSPSQTKQSPPSEPETSVSTPDQAKGSDIDALLAAKPEELTSDQLRAAADFPIVKEQFSKLGMKFAKRLNDNGAKAKEIWAKYKQADGSAIAGFGTTQPGDYAAMIGEWADALAEAEMS